MYMAVSGAVFAIGVLLAAVSKKIGRKQKAAALCFRIIGALMILGGLLSMYGILSGKIRLPLGP